MNIGTKYYMKKYLILLLTLSTAFRTSVTHLVSHAHYAQTRPTFECFCFLLFFIMRIYFAYFMNKNYKVPVYFLQICKLCIMALQAHFAQNCTDIRVFFFCFRFVEKMVHKTYYLMIIVTEQWDGDENGQAHIYFPLSSSV